MKKLVEHLYCDKCGKEIADSEEYAKIFNYDLCKGCENDLSKRGRKPKGKIDWYKACQLKNGGYSNQEIASMIGTTYQNVNSQIYKWLAKFRKGEEF